MNKIFGAVLGTCFCITTCYFGQHGDMAQHPLRIDASVIQAGPGNRRWLFESQGPILDELQDVRVAMEGDETVIRVAAGYDSYRYRITLMLDDSTNKQRLLVRSATVVRSGDWFPEETFSQLGGRVVIMTDAWDKSKPSTWDKSKPATLQYALYWLKNGAIDCIHGQIGLPAAK